MLYLFVLPENNCCRHIPWRIFTMQFSKSPPGLLSLTWLVFRSARTSGSSPEYLKMGSIPGPDTCDRQHLGHELHWWHYSLKCGGLVCLPHLTLPDSTEKPYFKSETLKNLVETTWYVISSGIARRAGQGGEMEESASHHLWEAISYALVRGKTMNYIGDSSEKPWFPSDFWNF